MATGCLLPGYKKVLELLKEKNAEDILLFGGGIIPEDDATELLKLGVRAVFGPGTPLDEIVQFVQENVVPIS